MAVELLVNYGDRQTVTSSVFVDMGSDLPDGRRRWPRVPLTAAAVLAHEHPFERLPEHFVENGVEHWVNHGTGVS